MAFPARYPARCADCGWPFDEGDLIAVTEIGPVHAACDDDAKAAVLAAARAVEWGD